MQDRLPGLDGGLLLKAGGCSQTVQLAVQVERLEEVRDQERESPIFTELPANHIFEVANLVLDNATQVSDCKHMCLHDFLQDIEKADEVRAVLKDLWDLRQAKLR